MPIAAGDDFLQVIMSDGLDEVIVEPGGHRRFPRSMLAEPGDRDKADMIELRVLANAPGQLVAVHARHRQVNQGEIQLRRAEGIKRFVAVVRDTNLVTT
jgi:hypothetical protein